MSQINRPFRGFSGAYYVPTEALTPSPTYLSTDPSSFPSLHMRSTSSLSPTSSNGSRISLYPPSTSHSTSNSSTHSFAPHSTMKRPHSADSRPRKSFSERLFPGREAKKEARRELREQARLKEIEADVIAQYMQHYSKNERRALYREYKEREKNGESED